MPRHTKHIDTTLFAGVMAEAMQAYSLDPEFACQMARAASAIILKRLSWACRSELRKANAEAVEACRLQPAFTCTNPAPCGVGRLCRFSAGDLTLLDLPAQPGKQTRPQPHESGPTYDVENAVKPLVAMREGGPQAA